MDWRSLKFDWNRARAFLVTAEEGSLAAAARALEMSQPTLGRQVAALEAEIGVNLFYRHGRGLELTPNGVALLEHVRGMGAAANRFSLSATGKSEAVEGDICITASELMASKILPPVLQQLRQAVPGIALEVIASNEEKNLNRREADIAIRTVRPERPDLIVRKLCDIRGHLYATPAYLKELGSPASLAELNEARFLDVEKSGRMMSMLNSAGCRLTEQNFPLITKSHSLQWELVKLGVGITGTAEVIGDPEPAVERLSIAGLPEIVGELWIVTHEELRTSRRVRTVFDFLVEAFEGNQLTMSA